MIHRNRWQVVGGSLGLLMCLWLVVHTMHHATTPVPIARKLDYKSRLNIGATTVLRDGSSLSGAVRDQRGRPIERARVCATALREEAVTGTRVVCVNTDSEGHYAFAPVTPDGYSIVAEAEGFLPGSVGQGRAIFVGSGEARTRLDIVLQHGGVELLGRVMDATGGPIAGALVQAAWINSPHRMIAVESNAEGQFELWVEPGPVGVSAQAAGYAPSSASHVAPSSDLVLTLTPGSTIQGNVVAAEGGKSVQDVAVSAVLVGSWNFPGNRADRSGPTGAFKIDGLEPGAYVLVGEGVGLRGTSAPLQISLAQSIDRVVLTVSSVAKLSGRILIRGADEEPCRQGSVSLGPTGPMGPTDLIAASHARRSAVPTMIASIESDGAVRFRAVPSGTYGVLVQCADHVLSNGPTTIDVGASDVEGIVWTVESGLRMVVHVVDASDHAVPNAPFWLYSPSRVKGAPQSSYMPLSTDGAGRYETPGVLSPGTYTITPDAGYDGEPVVVELREGMATVDATLRLTGRGSILVAVRTPNGDPIDSVTVTAEAVNAAAPGPASGSTVATTVVNRKAPTPPMPFGPSPILGVQLGKGRFRLSPVAAGRYHVQVIDGVNPPAEPTDSSGQLVEVATGSVVQTTVVLDRGGKIDGHVVDSSAQAVPDVWVSANCQSNGDSTLGPAQINLPGVNMGPGKRVVSDPEGKFTLFGLKVGSVCTVRAERPYGSVANKSNVHPGDDVLLAFPALGSLRGGAVAANGAPVEQFMISMSEKETSVTRTEMVAAPGGTWTLANLMPGQWHINAMDGQGAFAQHQIELAPGQILDGLVLTFLDMQAIRSPEPHSLQSP